MRMMICYTNRNLLPSLATWEPINHHLIRTAGYCRYPVDWNGNFHFGTIWFWTQWFQHWKKNEVDKMLFPMIFLFRKGFQLKLRILSWSTYSLISFSPALKAFPSSETNGNLWIRKWAWNTNKSKHFAQLYSLIFQLEHHCVRITISRFCLLVAA